MAQFLRPDNDFNNPDSWQDDGGGGANIYQAIDEEVAADGDYIQSPLNPSSDVYVARLSDGQDPALSTDHNLRVRYAKSAAGGAQIDVTVELREGYVNEGSQGSLIKQRVYSDVSDSFVTDEYGLSAGEADSITDYTDLFMRFVSNQV